MLRHPRRYWRRAGRRACPGARRARRCRALFFSGGSRAREEELRTSRREIPPGYPPLSAIARAGTPRGRRRTPGLRSRVSSRECREPAADGARAWRRAIRRARNAPRPACRVVRPAPGLPGTPAATSITSAFAVTLLNGASARSRIAWPNTQNRIDRATSARCSQNSVRHRNAPSSRPSTGSAHAMRIPPSSKSVSTSRAVPRAGPSPRRASSSQCSRFSSPFVRGNASHASALKRSCQLSARVSTSPVRKIRSS